jgi:3-oxoacyl-[acyl-carrier protein] reductase
MNGTVVIVIGASSGIGQATAELFAQRGAKVVMFSRSLTGKSTPEAHAALAISGDASSEADIERLFTECESQLGPCEILVNCAGMIDHAPMVDLSQERWDQMFAVNVRSIFLACRRALPKMIARRAGSIVNVASISGVPGPQKFPGFVSYCSSKAAVIGLTEALAVEVKGHGIRVNCVSPGSVDTKMWAAASGGAPADMTPAEIAQTILFLASDESRPMNGQNLNVYSA